jgi:U4/U6.U5 tri-snRNP-associated protein 2
MSSNNENASKKRKAEQRSCPYLDTINRSVLDFDFEPSCSVSLESGPHVYGCLVCGKFFRGRGQQTPAYTHCVDESHFIFVHLLKGTFHCLPDDYEVHDASLADISAALHPSYTKAEIAKLDGNTGLARDLFGRRYLPGFVGLNNLNKTDCVNATVQALAHVPPLRDYFLNQTHMDVTIPSRKKGKPPHRISPLVQAFGELIRKMWSDKRFKSHIDPHMLIQAISVASNKRFHVGHQAEAGEFMAWLLNQLHLGLGGTKRPKSSIIYEVFQGRVQVTTRQKRVINEKTQEEQDDRGGSDEELEVNEEDNEDTPASQVDETTTETNFLQLTLDIPEKPLFRDDEGGLVIPQEPLVSVLKKFDGVTFSDALTRNGSPQRRRYRLLELPKYLVLHLARFKTNQYSKEKNPTIVAFPVKNLDLGRYCFSPNGKETAPTEMEVRAMSVSDHGVSCSGRLLSYSSIFILPLNRDS